MSVDVDIYYIPFQLLADINIFCRYDIILRLFDGGMK